MKEELFFGLIRVAIGQTECLSHTPSAEEWQSLYETAKKQSLVGICFAGVQKLITNHSSFIIDLSEYLRLQWMGMAAKIQQRNEVMNRRCVEVQKKIELAGFRSLILKGQGLAALYYGDLAMLRQSGDIDVWVLAEDGASYDVHFKKVMAYAKTIGKIEDFNRQHVCVPFYKDTEVEVHFTPSLMNDPFCNKRLQRWFADEGLKEFQKGSEGFNVPSIEFNLVYLLQHCYNHLLFEGVGLRQIMDYYFVLVNTYRARLARTEGSNIGHKLSTNYSSILSRLGLLKFASAMMWVLHEVFLLDEQYMLVEPNAREGRFLLNEIMYGGNFGKYGQDGIMDAHKKGKVAFLLARMRRNLRMIAYYPSEVLWLPYACVKDYFWKLKVKY